MLANSVVVKYFLSCWPDISDNKIIIMCVSQVNAYYVYMTVSIIHTWPDSTTVLCLHIRPSWLGPFYIPLIFLCTWLCAFFYSWQQNLVTTEHTSLKHIILIDGLVCCYIPFLIYQVSGLTAYHWQIETYESTHTIVNHAKIASMSFYKYQWCATFFEFINSHMDCLWKHL